MNFSLTILLQSFIKNTTQIYGYLMYIVSKPIINDFSGLILTKYVSSLVGFEPTTFGLEVRRAIHCATETLLFQ